MSPDPSHHVVVLLHDGFQALDTIGPVDAFTSANAGGGRYRVTHASLDGRDVVASSGTRVGVDTAVTRLRGPIGTLLVPGAPDWQRAVSDGDLVAAVRDLAGRSDRVVSICAGAFPLAATGLLDGRRAATHWKLVRQLASRFPAVTVDPAAVYVADGRFVTSAGVTAGIDVTLWLIERDHGVSVARDVARDLVVFMSRPGDQSQFSVRADAPPVADAVVRAVLDRVTREPAADHSLRALAASAGISERHLVRRFRSETGQTPTRFVDRIRLEAACGLLTGAGGTVEGAARSSGVGSPESLRRLFLRELGVTPRDYRRRFAATRPG